MNDPLMTGFTEELEKLGYGTVLARGIKALKGAKGALKARKLNPSKITGKYQKITKGKPGPATEAASATAKKRKWLKPVAIGAGGAAVGGGVGYASGATKQSSVVEKYAYLVKKKS